MRLGEVFDRFAAASPVRAMARAAFAHALPSEAAEAVFAERADPRSTRELLFPQLVDRMGRAVGRVPPSLGAAVRPRAADLGGTRTAAAAQIARMGPGPGAARVRHTAARLGPVVPARGPGPGDGPPGSGCGGSTAATCRARSTAPGRSNGPGPGPSRDERSSCASRRPDWWGISSRAGTGAPGRGPSPPGIRNWAEPGSVWVGGRNVCTPRVRAGTPGGAGAPRVRAGAPGGAGAPSSARTGSPGSNPGPGVGRRPGGPPRGRWSGRSSAPPTGPAGSWSPPG